MGALIAIYATLTPALSDPKLQCHSNQSVEQYTRELQIH